METVIVLGMLTNLMSNSDSLIAAGKILYKGKGDERSFILNYKFYSEFLFLMVSECHLMAEHRWQKTAVVQYTAFISSLLINLL